MISNGFAPLSDLSRSEFKSVFNALEKSQAEFISQTIASRSKRYKWPLDPLHTWSRVWEYPFVYASLLKFLEAKLPAQEVAIADIGSGVTFFPFKLARKGFKVTCVDIDPICERDVTSAAAAYDCSPGTVTAMLCDENVLPLDDKSMDCIYSISVIEHIPDPAKIVDEIWRILKPGGILVLTLDVGLTKSACLSAQQLDALLALVADRFDPIAEARHTHPMGLLTTENSLYPVKRVTISEVKRIALDIINNMFRGGRSLLRRPSLGIFAACYRKRSTRSFT